MPGNESPLDHLVYGVPDLDIAIAELEESLGIAPSKGGQHVGRGTHNALLDLENGRYLEIIAVDPRQTAPKGRMRFGLDRLREPRLVTWCIRPTNFDATVSRAQTMGYDVGEQIEMSRQLPDGDHLSWRLATHTTRDMTYAGDGVVPFLIDWGASPHHPAAMANRGVRLVELVGEHPRPNEVMSKLDAVGARLALRAGEAPRLIATLNSPRGVVQIS